DQHHCTVAFLHSPQDVYTSTETSVDALTVADRKVGQRNLQVVRFVGTPPPPGTTDRWVAIDLFGTDREERLKNLVIDARSFRGQFGLLIPPSLQPARIRALERTTTKFAQ